MLSRDVLGGRLSARRLAERLNGNVLVDDLDYRQSFGAARRLEHNAFVRRRFHQCPAKRREPADVVACEIDFICTDDAHHALRARRVGKTHRRPEEDSLRGLPCPRSLRINRNCGFDSLAQKSNSAINLPKTALAVLIVGILTAIAIASRPRDDLFHSWPFPCEQEVQLIFQTLQATRRDVVAGVGSG